MSPYSTKSDPYDFSLDDNLKKSCDDLTKDCSIKDIRNMADYLYSKASDMSRALESSVTVDDFEKMKLSLDSKIEDTDTGEVEV